MSKIDIDALIAEVLRLDACASRDWRQDNCRIRRGAAAPLLTTTAHGEPVFIAYDDASAAVHCRTAAPVLAREVQRLMLRLAEVERERDEARAEAAKLTADREGAVKAAGQAMYFDDDADYGTALWEVLEALAPEVADAIEQALTSGDPLDTDTHTRLGLDND